MKHSIRLNILGAALLGVGVLGCSGGDDDENNNNENQNVNNAALLCSGDPPLATLQSGVCRGVVRECDPNVGWVEPDYTAVPGFQADETTCDEQDNDCDGEVDEGLTTLFFVDLDGDGHGSAVLTKHACSQPIGFVPTSMDCNDGNPLVSPDASEICDRLDNNCDGIVDTPDCELCPGDAPLASMQLGACQGATKRCDSTAGWVEPDYTAIPAYQANETQCDGADNDCDGTVDEGLTTLYYADFDGDGFGNSLFTQHACSQPQGFVTVGTDCNDGNPAVNTTALEVCNGLDDDCDGTIDAGPCIANAHCEGEGANIGCVCDDGYELINGVCEWLGWGSQSLHPMAAGQRHTCGLRAGRLYCWGASQSGALGLPVFVGNIEVPTRVGTDHDWLWIDSARNHTCGVRGGELYCWGDNGYGQLGTGDTQPVRAPVMVGDATTWEMVAAGGRHTCGIDDGELYCWGQGYDGQLGLGYTGMETDPQLVVGPTGRWVDVSASINELTCGITDNNGARTLYCWGRGGGSDNYGEALGNCNDDYRYLSPVEVGSRCGQENGLPALWTDVDAGGRFACAINDGALFCWGRNAWGQIGDGNPGMDVDAPVQIGTANDWVWISAGKASVCGIREDMVGDRRMYCWGKADYGILGVGTDVTGLPHCYWYDGGEGAAFICDQPTQVGTALNWDAVDVGEYHACGVADGVTYCWGENYDAQLAQPTASVTYSATPLQITNPQD